MSVGGFEFSREVPCPLCGTRNYYIYTVAPSHYGPDMHPVTKCRDCEMVFTNPQAVAYETEVENRGALSRHLEPAHLRGADVQARLQLALLRKYQKPGRLFDFGCGAGALVKAATDAGWDAIGLDLNRGLVEKANAHWKFDRLKTGTLEDFVRRNQNEFDTIVSNQVFEHLQSPVGLGKLLLQVLKPGGIILIDVPNLNQPREWFGKGKTLDPTSHWCHFSRRTLSLLMEKIGCEVLYSSASPAFAKHLKKLGLGDLTFSLATVVKSILPPIGSGVCVIGRKKG